MITLNDLKTAAPSVFATSASPKMSNKYVFVPTMDIMENFEREGWELATAKQVGRGIHAVHELRFRNSKCWTSQTCMFKRSNSTNGTF